MKNLLSAAAVGLLLAAGAVRGSAAPGTVRFVGETFAVAPFEFTVESVRYSQGKRFNKPGPGHLFLIMDVRVTNTTTAEAKLDWPGNLSVTSMKKTYDLDTVRNFAAQRGRQLAGRAEKKFTITFVVPEIVYKAGARAVAGAGAGAVTVDLRYADAYDGHLALGISHMEKQEFPGALLEFRRALALAEKDDEEQYMYVSYRIAETYSRLFMYEEAARRFAVLVERGDKAKYFKESKQNLDALKEQMKQETRQQKAVRLTEAGYSCAFLIGDVDKGLTIFEQLSKEFDGVEVGAYTADQVAAMYTVMIYINRKIYSKAQKMIQEAMAKERNKDNPEFAEVMNRQHQQILQFTSDKKE